MTPTPLPLARVLADPLPRGTRAAGANIPPNMRARLSAAEARAWGHSALAGALWESGHRAAVAVRMAENYFADCENNCCADSKTVQNSPRCQSQHPTGRNPETPLENTKMKIELFETTTDEQGFLTGRSSISHIKGDRAESIGYWEMPEGVTIGGTKYGEPGLFWGDNLMLPERMKTTIVLKAGIDRTNRAAWLFLKKA